jgi:hypothetical protein
MGELQLEGVEFNACGNTMNAMNSQPTELLPDFVRTDEGGVVRIAELQSKGDLYLRPQAELLGLVSIDPSALSPFDLSVYIYVG